MDQVQRQAFSKVYGKIWDLAMIELSVEAITSITQYYEQSLRCFSFGDFQLAPTIEEFEEILGCPIEGRKPYLFFWILPFYGESSRSIQDLRMRVRSSEAK